MSAPLLFLDTETTGLHPERDEIWEIAAVLRYPHGAEFSFHRFVEHEPDLCLQLPGEFAEDHRKRFPLDCQTGTRVAAGFVRPRAEAADELRTFNPSGVRPMLIGAVPGFDDERLGRLFRAAEGPFARQPWHYHVQDVETLIVGYLRGLVVATGATGTTTLEAPYDSNKLSLAVGVDPAGYDRHTAMGDVLWVRDQWDAVMGTSLAPSSDSVPAGTPGADQ